MFGYHGRYLMVDAGSGLAALQPLDEADSAGSSGAWAWGDWVVARECLPRRPAWNRYDARLRTQPAGRHPADRVGQLRGRRARARSPAGSATPCRRRTSRRRPSGRGSTRSRSTGRAASPRCCSWMVRGAASLWCRGGQQASCGVCRHRRLRPGCGRRSGPSGRSRRSGRRGSPHPVRHDQPRRPPRRPGGRGGAVRSGSRPSLCAETAARPWPTRTHPRAVRNLSACCSARRPRSSASWAPSRTCSCSTASRPCRPGTSRQASSPAAERSAAEDLARRGGPRSSRAAWARSGANTSMRHPTAGAGAHGVRVTLRLRPALRRGRPRGRPCAAAACDAAGLDTISTGGTIAFLMECVERNWVDGRLCRSGRSLRFGDGAVLLDAIAALIDRDGPLGELLALGSRRAVLCGSVARPQRFSPHVKGLELPGYHPRTLHAMALGLAVCTRGAYIYNRSGAATEADFTDHPRGTAAAIAAIATEDRSALMDSLILCKFLRGVFTDLYAESAAMLGASPGGTSPPTSCATSPAGSSTPASASTNARVGPAPKTPCRPACWPTSPPRGIGIA